MMLLPVAGKGAAGKSGDFWYGLGLGMEDYLSANFCRISDQGLKVALRHKYRPVAACIFTIMHI
jgi:hypothetical protein